MFSKNKLRKTDFIRTFNLILAVFLYAVTFNLILAPNTIVIGGMGGLILVITNYIDIDITVLIFILSALFLMIAYIFLTKKVLIQSLLAALAYPLFIFLTQDITNVIKLGNGDPLIIALFAGLMLGLSDGIVEKTGFLSGGTDILSKLINEKTKFSINQAIMITEGFIVILGFIAYGMDQLWYALLILYIISIVSNKIMFNVSKRKLLYIYTDDIKDVTKYIKDTVGYEVTVLKNKTLGLNQAILMVVVSTSDYYFVKEGVEYIDPHAKMIVFDNYEYFHKHKKTEEKEELLNAFIHQKN